MVDRNQDELDDRSRRAVGMPVRQRRLVRVRLPDGRIVLREETTRSRFNL